MYRMITDTHNSDVIWDIQEFESLDDVHNFIQPIIMNAIKDDCHITISPDMLWIRNSDRMVDYVWHEDDSKTRKLADRPSPFIDQE